MQQQRSRLNMLKSFGDREYTKHEMIELIGELKEKSYKVFNRRSNEVNKYKK